MDASHWTVHGYITVHYNMYLRFVFAAGDELRNAVENREREAAAAASAHDELQSQLDAKEGASRDSTLRNVLLDLQ